MSTQPQPKWDIDYESGRQAEIWVSDLRESLLSDSIEVKHDRKSADTGNIYLEYECLKRGKWCKSGIAVSTARLWVFVLVKDEFAIVITTERLKALARNSYKNVKRRKEERDGSHPTKGVVIPISELVVSILREHRNA